MNAKKETRYIKLSVLTSVMIFIFFIWNVFDWDKGRKYNTYFVILLLLFLMFLWLITFIFSANLNHSVKRYFIIFTIGWGIIMQMVLPPFSGTDEGAHYFSAYYASHVFLQTSPTNEEGDLLIREGDQNWHSLNVKFPDQYEEIFRIDNWRMDKSDHYVQDPNIYFISWIRYIPTGIGIAIARCLHLGMIPTIYLGRVMNLLLYILTGLYVIRILPAGKVQFVSFAMLPLMLQQISSYSYDALSINLSIIFVAQCLKCSMDQYEIKLYDILILLITYVFLVPNKGVYSALGLMLLIIPFGKWKKYFGKMLRSTKGKITSVILLALLGIATYKWIIQWFYKFLTLLHRSDSSIEQYADMKAYTWDYAVSHPGNTGKILWNTLIYKGWSGFMSMMGRTMGHHKLSIQIPTVLLLLLLLCVLANLFLSSGKLLKKKTRIIWLITSAVTVLLIWIGCMIRFTPIDADSLQVAGRYYLPIFTCGLLVFGKDGEINKRNISVLYLQHIVMMAISCYIIYALLTM